MALSQAYLEWERQTEQRGRTQGIEQGEQRWKAALILMQLRSRLGDLPSPVELQIEELSVPALDALAIALLSLSNITELEEWLRSA
ncbi:DUF4351 domain-containing protein [Pseudanabaenaceae cyanobacterium LEGE 13415]|nr:DUF4351 domain-containing protein [Pseudanabaenaceae cyanobacterium LEGE 13415]